MGRTLIAPLRRHGDGLLLAVAGLVLLTAALLPLLALVSELFWRPAGFVRALGALSTGRIWLLFLRSLGMAGAVTALTVLLGVPLGLLLGRADVPGRRWALVLHGFPMFLPPFLLALGWFHLLGRGGLWGSAFTSRLLFSAPGAVGIQVLAFTPIVTSLVSLGLQGIDPSLEEAARTVAPPWRVATRILLPVASPTAALGALVVFALSFSELGVPMFLRVPAYPSAVFTRLGGIEYAPGEAFVLTLPLLGVAIGLVWLERRLLSRRSFTVLGLRLRERPALPLGRWRAVATGLCWLMAGIPLLPLVALARAAGRGGGFTAAPSWLGAGVTNSLIPAAAAATLLVGVGLILGRAIARRSPGARPLDAVAVLAFVTPAAVLGVGLIAVWNRPLTQALYTSAAIIAVGYVARYGVIAARALAAAIAQAPPHLEEAAAVCGAGPLRRLTRIVLPLHIRAVALAWLLTLVFCLRDLDTTILFYPPGREPLPVRIFTLEANGPAAVVAALALIHVALTAAIVATGAALAARSRPT